MYSLIPTVSSAGTPKINAIVAALTVGWPRAQACSIETSRIQKLKAKGST
jgi:hypothetical protein